MNGVSVRGLVQGDYHMIRCETTRLDRVVAGYHPRCKFCRGKFVAWGSTPRPGSRGGSVTLGHPSKAIGSARIARAPRARDLVAQGSGLSAAGRTN